MRADIETGTGEEDRDEAHLDRKSGFLTPSQRRFLQGETDPSKNYAHQLRYRIRDRLEGVIRDFHYLRDLREDEFQKVYKPFTIGYDDDAPDESLPALWHILGGLYVGLGQDWFEDVLATGIRQSIIDRELRERDIYPSVSINFDVQIDPESSIPVDELLARLKEREEDSIPDWFNPIHYTALVRSDKIDELEEEYADLLEEGYRDAVESRDKERRKEMIKEASAADLVHTGYVWGDEEDIQRVIEERKEEIAEELLESPDEWGLSPAQIQLLEDVGVFDIQIPETDETVADRYERRYRYVHHLHECAGLVDSSPLDPDGQYVTPDMFDEQMAKAHRDRARQLEKKYRMGEQLDADEFRCLLAEGHRDNDVGLDYSDLEDGYGKAVAEEAEQEIGDQLPPEYHYGN